MKGRWVERQALLLHDESLAEHGGVSGLREEGLFDFALARPLNLIAYGKPDKPVTPGKPDFADLAASYGAGLAQNHPFIDGNKRTAFLAVGLFLYLNGFRLNASQAEATVTLFSLASGELDEATFAAWIRTRSEKH